MNIFTAYRPPELIEIVIADTCLNAYCVNQYYNILHMLNLFNPHTNPLKYALLSLCYRWDAPKS